jgi:hypothetical protein
MLVKNTHDTPVVMELSTRTIRLDPGDETGITAEEVKDAAMRDHLQIRTVSIVRPTTEEENAELIKELARG